MNQTISQIGDATTEKSLVSQKLLRLSFLYFTYPISTIYYVSFFCCTGEGWILRPHLVKSTCTYFVLSAEPGIYCMVINCMIECLQLHLTQLFPRLEKQTHMHHLINIHLHPTALHCRTRNYTKYSTSGGWHAVGLV